MTAAVEVAPRANDDGKGSDKNHPPDWPLSCCQTAGVGGLWHLVSRVTSSWPQPTQFVSLTPATLSLLSTPFIRSASRRRHRRHRHHRLPVSQFASSISVLVSRLGTRLLFLCASYFCLFVCFWLLELLYLFPVQMEVTFLHDISPVFTNWSII